MLVDLHRGRAARLFWAALSAVVALALLAAGSDAQPAGFVPGRLLVRFRAATTPDQARALAAAAGAADRGEIARTGIHVLQLPARADERALAASLGRRPEVAFAELDHTYKAAACPVTPNDPYFASWEWHLKRTACPTAWCTTRGSSTVVIAILDTGCDPTHPDLAGQYVAGWNALLNTADTADVMGHGTAVAGVAAASTNNGLGVASVAGGCRIMPIVVADATGCGYTSAMAAGLTWAADHGARVANLSFSVEGSPTIDTAAQYFMAKGGVVVNSAGNDGTCYAIPDDPTMLTVSATDASDLLCTWSTYGTMVDVAAPGTAWTTVKGGTYNTIGGTSVSSPIVAGVAALAFSANPALTGQQVYDIIRQSADLVQGATGWTPQYGCGRVNASAAVALAGGGGSSPTVTIDNPLAGATVAGSVSVKASASDTVAITALTISVDGTVVTTVQDVTATYTWNTTAAANGSHLVSSKVTDALGNTASADATVTVNNAPPDTAPPTCVITKPTPGTVVGSAATLAVTASATDTESGVAKVALYVDGSLLATCTAAPWQWSANTKKWRAGTSHTLQCWAYDRSGNVGRSVAVTVRK